MEKIRIVDIKKRRKRKSRQKEKSSFAGGINQTVKGEKGRESKRGATDQEKQPGPRDQETSVAKMAVLYRGRAHILHPVQLR